MRLAMALLLMFVALVAQAQSDIWKQVNPNYDGPRLQSVQPSGLRLKAIAAMLRQNVNQDNWGCEGSDLDAMIDGLSFEEIPLAPGREVLLAQAGPGCGRGGQGANGEMWLIQFDGDRPVLLASPGAGFEGWLFAIQPTASNGYKDVILGWHMSADDYGLTYFRFDGKSYAVIGHAEDVMGTITPKRQ
jgi:hypothetical protein